MSEPNVEEDEEAGPVGPIPPPPPPNTNDERKWRLVATVLDNSALQKSVIVRTTRAEIDEVARVWAISAGGMTRLVESGWEIYWEELLPETNP